MSDEQATFWMTPRNVLNPERCSYKEQRALITHAVLFGGPLLISDSDFINNLHLRNAVASGDRYIIPLIERGTLRFATREREGKLEPLGITAEGILKRNGHSRQIPRERFGDAPEFRFIENNAKVCPFSFEGAASRYHRETLRILETANFDEHDLPHEVRSALLNIVRAYGCDHQLTWSYFTLDSPFWDELDARLPGTRVRERFGNFIFSVVRGPYATFFPDALQVNPTYSNEDKIGVELWRGRYGMSEEVLERKQLKRSRIALGDFVHGLASLSATDVFELRDSDERAEYEAGCRQLSRGTLFPHEPLVALHRFRRRVDDAVLQALSRKRDGDEVEEVYEASSVGAKISSAMGPWCKLAVRMGVSSATYQLSDVLEFGYQRFQAMRGKDEASEEVLSEREKEVRKEIEIARLPDKRLVESLITVDEPTVRDFFTTVS